MLFMSVEGALDASGGDHPHQDGVAHTIVDDDPALDTHDSDGHCSDCCHGHASGIAGQFAKSHCDNNFLQFAFYQRSFQTIPQAPPTPPPNA